MAIKYSLLEIETHLATLRQTAALFGAISEDLDERQARVRLDPAAWSLVELLAHLHACAEIWGDDIERLLDEDSPVFKKPHPRQVMRAGRHLEPSFAESAHAFADRREGLSALLASLRPEQWERGATIDGRQHTVYSQTRRMALHEAAHIEQVHEMWRAVARR